MSGWVLITGAARRIGRAIALDLADHGWDVVVHYNRSKDDAEEVAKLIAAKGRQAVLAEIDLARLDHVAKLIPSLSAELGPLQGLVNNASLFELDKDDPNGQRHMAINAEAPRLLCEAFYRQMPEGKTGAIVNLLDGTPSGDNLSGYAQSKAILKAETLAMAKRYAPRLRINGVAPGPILANARQTEKHFLEQLGELPLKTRIPPEEIAHTVRFLLSTTAITGHIIPVDGGLHLFPPILT